MINPIITAIYHVRRLIGWLQNAWSSVRSLGGRLHFAAGAPQVTGVFADDVMRFYPTPPDLTAAYTPQWAASMPLRTSPVEESPAVQQTVNITINGVLNAEDAAREIRNLLDREGLRQSW